MRGPFSRVTDSCSYYDWKTRGARARDEPPPTLELTRQGLIDLLAEADVTYPAQATKTVLLRLLTLHREDPYLQFSQAIEKATAVRTLESLARIELAAQGGALLERVTTTRISKSGLVLLRCGNGSPRQTGMPMAGSDWSRRTELVLPDHDQNGGDHPILRYPLRDTPLARPRGAA